MGNGHGQINLGELRYIGDGLKKPGMKESAN
jgi:hypothetical protein